MKQGAIPENPVEAAALVAGLVPTPLLDTIVSALLMRTILTAVRLGVFAVLADGPLASDEVAARCGSHSYATAKLLGALCGCGYLRYRGGRYALTRASRTWLLPDSPKSLHDALLYQFVDLRFIERMEDYVRTGAPVRIHEEMSTQDWDLYMRGMRSGANLAASEIALRVPVPRGARDMLDIGGSHGHYAVELCRRHPSLRAVVFDLPEAVAAAAPLLAREGMGDRVVHRAGDARTADFAVEAYDLILIANLVHHFDESTNRDLVVRCARALRPGGVLVLGDVLRPASPDRAGQIGALTDLYFAVTSKSGTWSVAEMAAWQRAAGLRPRRPIRLLTGPGTALLAAARPMQR